MTNRSRSRDHHSDGYAEEEGRDTARVDVRDEGDHADHKMRDARESRTRRSPSRGRSGSRSRSRDASRYHRSARSSPPSAATAGQRRDPLEGRENPVPTRVLGVFGLSLHTRERDLEELYGEFGIMERCNLIMDKRENRSRCFGFVYYERIEDATRALEKTNGMFLHGRTIRVAYSLTEKAHDPTPGQYMGRRVSPARHSTRRSRSRSPRDSRDSYKRRYSRSPPAHRERRDYRDNRDHRDYRDSRDNRDHRDVRDRHDGRPSHGYDRYHSGVSAPVGADYDRRDRDRRRDHSYSRSRSR